MLKTHYYIMKRFKPVVKIIYCFIFTFYYLQLNKIIPTVNLLLILNCIKMMSYHVLLQSNEEYNKTIEKYNLNYDS